MSRSGEAFEPVSRQPVAPRVADGLALAASPTFAVMALLAATSDDGPAAMLCSAAPASPLTGMAAMYVLMTAIHARPWLKLIREAGHRTLSRRR